MLDFISKRSWSEYPPVLCIYNAMIDQIPYPFTNQSQGFVTKGLQGRHITDHRYAEPIRICGGEIAPRRWKGENYDAQNWTSRWRSSRCCKTIHSLRTNPFKNWCDCFTLQPSKVAQSILLFCKGQGLLTSVAMPGIDRNRAYSTSSGGSTDGQLAQRLSRGMSMEEYDKPNIRRLSINDIGRKWDSHFLK